MQQQWQQQQQRIVCNGTKSKRSSWYNQSQSHSVKEPAFSHHEIFNQFMHPSVIFLIQSVSFMQPFQSVIHPFMHPMYIIRPSIVARQSALPCLTDLCTYLYTYTVMFTFAALIIIIMHTKLNILQLTRQRHIHTSIHLNRQIPEYIYILTYNTYLCVCISFRYSLYL